MNYIFPFAYFNIKPNHKYLIIKNLLLFQKDFPEPFIFIILFD